MAPVFLSDAPTAWDTTTSPKTAQLTCNAGDLIVVSSVTENSTTELNAPTATGLTFAQVAVLGPTAGYANVYVYTARTASSGTITISQTVVTASGRWGFAAERWNTPQATGSVATGRGTGAPYRSILPQTNGGALLFVAGDTNAIAGGSRVWYGIDGSTPTAANGLERTYDRQANHYTIYRAYWPVAGGAGAPEYELAGLDAPTGQQWAAICTELTNVSTFAIEAVLAATATLTAAAAAETPAVQIGASLAVTASLSAGVAPSLRTYTTAQVVAENPGPDPYESWFGAELLAVPDYDPDNPNRCVMTGGFFAISSVQPQALDQAVAILPDTGLKTDVWWGGDPGYHVHFSQPAGDPGFALWACLEYRIAG